MPVSGAASLSLLIECEICKPETMWLQEHSIETGSSILVVNGLCSSDMVLYEQQLFGFRLEAFSFLSSEQEPLVA